MRVLEFEIHNRDFQGLVLISRCVGDLLGDQRGKANDVNGLPNDHHTSHENEKEAFGRPTACASPQADAQDAGDSQCHDLWSEKVADADVPLPHFEQREQCQHNEAGDNQPGERQLQW